MTALTTPARPKHDAGLRPVPWRRMAWVTWRQHRAALIGVAVFLGAPGMHHAQPFGVPVGLGGRAGQHAVRGNQVIDLAGQLHAAPGLKMR